VSIFSEQHSRHPHVHCISLPYLSCLTSFDPIASNSYKYQSLARIVRRNYCYRMNMQHVLPMMCVKMRENSLCADDTRYINERGVYGISAHTRRYNTYGCASVCGGSVVSIKLWWW